MAADAPPPTRRPAFPGLPRPAAVAALVLAAAPLLGGCGRSMVDDLAPWAGNFNPPTVMIDGRPRPTVVNDRAVVVGHFEAPPFASVEWDGVGPDMSDALARTLLNRGRLNVLVNPRLASDVANLRNLPDDERLAELQRIRRNHPTVRLVINGRITDFLHTEDIDSLMRRRTWYLSRSREAVVAIQLDVFDLELGRTVATDHIVGAADAPKKDAEELYRNVSFDSAIFWATPLGRATKESVLAAVEVLDQMVPTAGPQIVIAERQGRDLEIYVSSGDTLRRGERLYVYERADDGSLIAIRDPASGQQLRVHVLQDSRSRASGFLYGLPAEGVDLRGAELLRVSARERSSDTDLAGVGG